MSRTLPPSIFNLQLYRNILSVWFDGKPVDKVTPSFDIIKRWFGSLDYDAKTAFDESCRQVSLPALNQLHPDRMPLPPFIDRATERKASASIAQPILALYSAAVTAKSADEEAQRATRQDEPTLAPVDIALALVLLLDQMPRNIFRQPPEQKLVFSHYDRIAQAFARIVVEAQEPNFPNTTTTTTTTFSPSVSRSIISIDKVEDIRLLPSRREWFYMPLMHSEDLADHDLASSRIADLEAAFAGGKRRAEDPAADKHVTASLDSEQKHRLILEQFGRYPYRNKCLGRETTDREREWLKTSEDSFAKV